MSQGFFVDASTDMGDTLVCDDCDSELELVGLDPFELDPAQPPDPEVGDGFNIFEEDE